MKQQIEYRNRLSREKHWKQMDEDVSYVPSRLDRDILNPSQIRTVIRAFRENLYTALFPRRSEVPYDEAHSEMEDRYDTIGDTSAGNLTIIGNLQDIDRIDDILFVVYTERIIVNEGGKSEEVIRLISARLATSFERGVYYGKRS